NFQQSADQNSGPFDKTVNFPKPCPSSAQDYPALFFCANSLPWDKKDKQRINAFLMDGNWR
ncbi:hypothetical protein, partial [Desulfobacter curvatus]|uniref:hypothetical protein n=1 Tax=Desulfobacter curvatus TaxID=2290 RepID=UPI001B7F97B0